MGDEMSHRRPPTVADRHIRRMLDEHPALAGVTTACDSFSPLSMQFVFDECDTTDIRELTSRYCTDPSMILPQDVALWSRWRTSRHVYRFDRDLTDALLDAGTPDSMPMEPLARLPYPCIFVEARTRLRKGGGDVTSPGFFCFLDHVMRPGAPSWDDVEDALTCVMLYDDGNLDARGAHRHVRGGFRAHRLAVRYAQSVALGRGLKYLLCGKTGRVTEARPFHPRRERNDNARHNERHGAGPCHVVP